MFLAGLSQKYLENRLEIEVESAGKATILEVKEEKGLGKTVDVILYDGKIAVGDEIALGGKQGVITSKVRALLQPKPLEEIREAEKKFSTVKEVAAAAGVKIAAPQLDEALAGSPLIVVKEAEDIERLKDEIKELTIESDAIGPILRADTLGSLEAFVKMLEKEGLKVRRADVGEVSLKDLKEIEGIKEKDPYKGVVFAFNIKVAPEIKREAEAKGVKIFDSNVVYRLLEDYQDWSNELREQEKREKLGKIAYPVELKVLPDHIFRHSKPAIVGVKVARGKLKSGVKVFCKNKMVGKIHAIQSKGENVKEASSGEEVAVSIMEAVVGRTLNEKDVLYTYLPRGDLAEIEKLSAEFSDEEKELIEEIKSKQKKLKVEGEEE
jgi:translation initiation factor 5B